MLHHDVDLDPGQLDVVAIQVGHPFVPPGFHVQAPAARFFVTGVVVPEPSSLAQLSLGTLILLGYTLRHRKRSMVARQPGLACFNVLISTAIPMRKLHFRCANRRLAR
jgi:hypothetical protein